jgi:lactoylglutathione lyase
MNSIALNLVMLRASDLAKAEAFYSLLGLSFSRHRHGTGPEHLAAELEGCVFEIYPQTPDAPASVGARIGFAVPSVDEVVARLGGFPDAVVSAAKDSPWGRRAVLRDPDNHRVEVVESMKN